MFLQCKLCNTETTHIKKRANVKDASLDIFECETRFAHVAKCDHCAFIRRYKGGEINARDRYKCYNHAKACQRNMERIIEESVEIQQHEETNDM